MGKEQICMDRRTFVGGTLAVAGLATARCVRESDSVELAPGATVLFQGDSITDAGRNREELEANREDGLGQGYAYLVACGLLAEHPGLGLRIFNRGVSGNKVPDLAERWQRDTLDLKPLVLSILIGVNDIWHKLHGRYEGTVAEYETGYRALLRRTLDELGSETRIVLCEPFALRCGAVGDNWFPEFDQRRAVAKRLAMEMDLTFVPFQSMFDQASKQAPPEYWAADGVHPTPAGHALMARTWREVTGL